MKKVENSQERLHWPRVCDSYLSGKITYNQNLFSQYMLQAFKIASLP